MADGIRHRWLPLDMGIGRSPSDTAGIEIAPCLSEPRYLRCECLGIETGGWSYALAVEQSDRTQAWGLLNQLQLNPLVNITVSVILLDLVYYGTHRLNHRVSVLWRFHRAHHSDLDVDVTTGLRFHLGGNSS